jgi:hypothetical protein
MVGYDATSARVDARCATGSAACASSALNHSTEQGIWPFDSETLNPISDWVFARGDSRAYIPQGKDAALPDEGGCGDG